MKKMMIFAVSVLMSMTASAIEFNFAPIDKVAQAGDGFFAYAGGESVAISALQYAQMKDADGYYILSVNGKKVVAAGDEFLVESLIVDEVTTSATTGGPKLLFTNGTAKVFTKAEWLKALKGQKVRRAYLNIPTWEFENYSTVDEGQVVVCHSKVAPTKKATALTTPPAPSAPTAQQPAAPTVPTAQQPAAPTVPTAQQPAQSNGNSGITFRVTKK